MTTKQDKVFIVDDKMQHIMRRDSLYADLKRNLENEGFEVICLDDKQNIELFSDKRKPIGDYQGIAVRSDLYKTDKCYYPMLDYAESYFEHLNLIMEDMAACMGASAWDFNYLEEQLESNKQSSGFDASVNINVANKGGGGVGYAQSNASGNSDESKYSNTTKAKLNKNRKKSPQEFDVYIKEQEIDIDVFDPHFKDRIQRYIKGEEVLDLEKTIDKSKRISQYVKTCYKLSANAKICRIFDMKFKLDLKSELNTERKYRTKLFYRMAFSK